MNSVKASIGSLAEVVLCVADCLRIANGKERRPYAADLTRGSFERAMSGSTVNVNDMYARLVLAGTKKDVR
jgi:hypothetical protein